MKIPKTNLVLTLSTEHLMLLIQLLGALAVLVGISFWSVPAALIVGGVVAIAAIEMQNHEPAEDDQKIKNLIDASVASGQNPFTSEDVPVTQKWLAYAQLVTRKL